MKKLAVLVSFIIAFVGGTLAPAVAGETLIIGISTPTADHGWTGGIIWWAEQAVAQLQKKHPTIKFIMRASASEREQAADVEAMLKKKVRALVILPHKPAPLTTLLNKAHKAGVFIVVVDRSIPKVPKDIYLAGDNKDFGRKNGEYMVKALGGTGNILVMEGIPCEGNSLRVSGFKETLAGYPGIVVMDSQPAYWSPPKGYELMQRYLQQFPSIDAVWCGDDDVLESVLKAYAESGRNDIKFFLGGGGSKAIIKRVLEGDTLVPVTVTYPPEMIFQGTEMAVKHLTTGETFPLECVIPSELVTRENAAHFYHPDSIY